MGICLYYVMTAHHGETVLNDALTAQKLFGLGLKTFHDVPVITDNTFVGAAQILPDVIRGGDNGLQIILRPTSPDEAVSFWSSEHQSTIKLSAFYEVRIVLLEPEAPTSIAAPVLQVGTFVKALSAPSLEVSESVVSYTTAAINGGELCQVVSRPARAGLNVDTVNDPPETRVTFHGYHLTGKSQQLYLTSPYLPGKELEVGWEATTYSQSSVTTHLEETVGVDSDVVYPGSYGAFVRTVVEEQVLLGQLKQITNVSNTVPFSVQPVISATARLAPDTELEVELAGDYIDDPHPDVGITHLLHDATRIVFGGQTYEYSTTIGPGLFVIESAPKVRLRLQASASIPDGTHALRVIVRGAESAAYWVELP